MTDEAQRLRPLIDAYGMAERDLEEATLDDAFSETLYDRRLAERDATRAALDAALEPDYEPVIVHDNGPEEAAVLALLREYPRVGLTGDALYRDLARWLSSRLARLGQPHGWLGGKPTPGFMRSLALWFQTEQKPPIVLALMSEHWDAPFLLREIAAKMEQP